MSDRQSEIRFLCPVKECRRAFKSKTTWTRHLRSVHPLVKFQVDDNGATIVTLPRAPTPNNRHPYTQNPLTSPDGGASEYANSDIEMETFYPTPLGMYWPHLSFDSTLRISEDSNSSPPPHSSDSFDPEVYIEYHPHINGKSHPCIAICFVLMLNRKSM